MKMKIKIKGLKLKNFRGFKELEIKFPESELIVFVGINGAGKSSILDCISLFLSRFVSELCDISSRFNEFPITDDDINIEENETINTLALSGLPNPLPDIFEEPAEPTQKWVIKKSRFDGKRESKQKQTMDKEMEGYITFLRDELITNPLFSLPVFVYYQNHKSFLETPSKNRVKIYKFNQFYAYENAFKKEVYDFSDFAGWFRQQEDWENEKKLKEGLDFTNKNLEVVRRAIRIFLENIPSNDLANLHVVRTQVDKPFRFDAVPGSSLRIDKNGSSLKIEQLSDGEKMLVLMVSDLARRLSIANPASENPLNGEGIVLIDEVDLHLHPQWQREVVPAFRRTFPRCQFILTTHSPQVLSNVEKENILILENSGVVEQTPFTYGKDSNSILYQLMNVEERPNKVKAELDKLYHLIDDEKIADAREELKKLAELLGDDDKDIVRAHMYIDFQND
jgi:predicted ATP-binding protein involved in virulence